MESERLTEDLNPLNEVADMLWFEPPIRNHAEEQYIMYFITGNPGLVSYYAIFMHTLSSLLHKSSAIPMHFCGSSLPGFGIATSEPEVESRIPAGIEEQVTNTEKLIQKAVKHHEEMLSYDASTRLILIGHSIGCYILLEILRRQRAGRGRLDGVEIAGGILLFPTIIDIGKSWNGQIVQALCSIPYFITIAVWISRVCTFFFSVESLVTLFRLFVKMPLIVARTTAQFLHSRTGVEQALFMAKTEMEIVTEDKWSEDVWGAANNEEDGWVSNHIRDEVIRKRGRSDAGLDDWKPKMMIDRGGVPHGFILDHNQIIAEKTKEWVEEIVKKDRGNKSSI